MSAAWLEDILPYSWVSAKTRIWWLIFFALFPLAYVGGVLLELSEDSPARIAGAEDRAAAVRTAKAFAENHGVSVAGWNTYVIAETHRNVLAYYTEKLSPAQFALLSDFAPARQVQVLFRPSDNVRQVRVYLSLTGHVSGYDLGKSSNPERSMEKDFGLIHIQSNTTSDSDADDASGQDPKAKEIEAIARRSLAGDVTLNSLVSLGKPTISANSDDPDRTDLAWSEAPAGLKGLILRVSASVRNSKVIAQRVEPGVDKADVVPKRKLAITLRVIYGLFLWCGACYAIYRYAKRTLQKEVSHVRTLVVTVLFTISFGTFAYCLAIDELATIATGQLFNKIAFASYIASGITFAIMGLLVGLAYGSGEGEVREAYPGKLTSLDALLAGRVFSRDVGVSILCGAASAGWLLLLHHGVSYFLKNDVIISQENVLSYTFARLPWLTLMLGKQYDSLLIAASGLLLPASLLLRSRMRKPTRFIWLVICAIISVLNDAATYPTLPTAALAAAVFAAALLLPFFAFDLLAAIVSLSALAYVGELAELAAAFPSWSGFALTMAVLAFTVIAVNTYLALRGQRVREEDVRPLYAKNLAERMSMQAEILAAREAQLRLLPQAVPEIPGIQFAACCLPAHGVGGDFYDFFRLDANRIGIFVAQGSAQGLASALCIALAKGVLMHSALQPHTPAQILISLEASIAELLEGGSGSGIGFAYGVMDTRRNLLNYARLGSSPQLLLHRPGIALTVSGQMERLVQLPGRSKTAPNIYEGAAHTQPGDYLIFFTGGIAGLRSRRFGPRQYQWLDILMREFGRPDEPLQTALISSLSKYQRQASEDLTAVVLRISAAQAVLQEVVA